MTVMPCSITHPLFERRLDVTPFAVGYGEVGKQVFDDGIARPQPRPKLCAGAEHRGLLAGFDVNVDEAGRAELAAQTLGVLQLEREKAVGPWAGR
ncbi:MAG: hypothetical protein R3F54_16430 [Alphaproteobacteria bacterium]